MRPGERVWVLGPLGRGFDVAEMCARPAAASSCSTADVGSLRPRLVVVAGGVGLAPFPLLLMQVVRSAAAPGSKGADVPSEVLVLAGFGDAEGAAAIETCGRGIDLLRRQGIPSRVRIVTEDGSAGCAGLVTDLLAEEVRAGDRVAACGPHGMTLAVWRVCATAGAPAWFSLEARMACGVGSCHGCVVHVADGRLVRVCRSGPVMSGEEAFGAIDAAV
jgi:dihydroorotate dehydrogenase electron transfer subunit